MGPKTLDPYTGLKLCIWTHSFNDLLQYFTYTSITLKVANIVMSFFKQF